MDCKCEKCHCEHHCGTNCKNCANDVCLDCQCDHCRKPPSQAVWPDNPVECHALG